jgi:hypothetical protein
MTDKQKLSLYRFLNFIFRLVVPAITAGFIFGLFKNDVEISSLDKLSGGFFVIVLLLFTEIKDFVQKQFEQLKLDNRVAFSKNRALLFLGLGVFVLLVRVIADKAIPFLFISGGSCAVAWICEWKANKLYRIVYPVQVGMVVHG